jgi:hypothetical protein
MGLYEINLAFLALFFFDSAFSPRVTLPCIGTSNVSGHEHWQHRRTPEAANFGTKGA